MKAQKFQFRHKDVPMLKKDVAMRTFFSLLFVGVFVWQILLIFFKYFNAKLSTFEVVCSSLTMLISLFMAMVSFVFLFRSLNNLICIKKSGNAVGVKTPMFNSKKTGFFNLYYVVSTVIAWVMTFVLVCSITYAVLEGVFYNQFSIFLPALVLTAISGYNSVYHLKNELTILKEVDNYTSVY